MNITIETDKNSRTTHNEQFCTGLFTPTKSKHGREIFR